MSVFQSYVTERKQTNVIQDNEKGWVWCLCLVHADRDVNWSITTLILISNQAKKTNEDTEQNIKSVPNENVLKTNGIRMMLKRFVGSIRCQTIFFLSQM